MLTDPNNPVLFVSRLGDGLTASHSRACASKNGAAEIEAAKLLAALEAEQAEEVERSGAACGFDEEPPT